MALPALPLPMGVRSRQVSVNDLSMHILEAGYTTYPDNPNYPNYPAKNPLILLLHGFPEIAYSWRKLIGVLASTTLAHIVAPDLRGYGRTTGWSPSYHNPNLIDFSFPRAVLDMIALVDALGHKEVKMIVGHDNGSSVASWCALARPDVFKKLAMVSSPFAGPPSRLFTSEREKERPTKPLGGLTEELEKIGRVPYKWYYSTEQANSDMHDTKEGLHKFFRGYFHQKSADWDGKEPHRLEGWTAEEFAKMPRYYVMNSGDTMRDVADADMPTAETVEKKSSRWLPEEELAVYSEEYARTGFQGGLNYYRTMTTKGEWTKEMEIFSGMKIVVPAVFIAGDKDWGRWQLPNVVDSLAEVCTHYLGDTVVKRAGHWAQQERPEKMLQILLEFWLCKDTETLEKFQGTVSRMWDGWDETGGFSSDD